MEDDADMLTNSINNASIFFVTRSRMSGARAFVVQDGQELDLGDTSVSSGFSVTPGHHKRLKLLALYIYHRG